MVVLAKEEACRAARSHPVAKPSLSQLLLGSWISTQLSLALSSKRASDLAHVVQTCSYEDGSVAPSLGPCLHGRWNGRWVLYIRWQEPHVRSDQRVSPIISRLVLIRLTKAHRM